MQPTTLDLLFLHAAKIGLQLGNMFQTSYVKGSESANDAWSAHFHDGKGKWFKGFGRSPYDAVADALNQTKKLIFAPQVTDEEAELM